MEMEMEMERKKKKEKTEIPPEIIVDEIMWRLPVKALARFRSVCNTWNSIIASDPNFAILQLKNSSATSCDRQRVLLWHSLDICSAFFQEKNNNSEFAFKMINTSPLKVKGSYRCHLIVASCDGLVCILHQDQVTNSILFWNPLTGETKRVSVPPSGIPPLSPRCTYGLGYDSSTDDYKLVWIKHGIVDNVAGLRKPDEVGVFSLRTNSWRQIQDFPTGIIFPPVPGVFINGALYWTGYSVDSTRLEVASFCLEKEKCRLLNIPLTDFRVCRCGVQALGDKLAVYYQSNAGGSCRLLMMNPCENSESWTEHTVTLPSGDWFTPLCPLKNVEEVLFKVNGFLHRDHLGIYRFSDGTFRHLQAIGLPRTFHTMAFSESLISPNTYKGMN